MPQLISSSSVCLLKSTPFASGRLLLGSKRYASHSKKNIFDGSFKNDIDIEIEKIFRRIYVGADDFFKSEEKSDRQNAFDTNVIYACNNSEKETPTICVLQDF